MELLLLIGAMKPMRESSGREFRGQDTELCRPPNNTYQDIGFGNIGL